MNALTIKEAKSEGLKRYFTGVACPYGHVAERIVSTRACSECTRGKKHKWIKENPEKVNAQKRSWRDRNIDHARELNLANQKLHRDSANRRNRKWLAANREQSNKASKDWAVRHPEKRASIAAKRRAAELKQLPAWADLGWIGMIYCAAEVVRRSGFDVHVDHVIPLQGKTVSGLHVHNNLQILEAKANQSKANHF